MLLFGTFSLDGCTKDCAEAHDGARYGLKIKEGSSVALDFSSDR
jgi:hypothetical protein